MIKKILSKLTEKNSHILIKISIKKLISCDGEILKVFPLIVGTRQGYLFSLLLFTTILCTRDASLSNKPRK